MSKKMKTFIFSIQTARTAITVINVEQKSFNLSELGTNAAAINLFVLRPTAIHHFPFSIIMFHILQKFAPLFPFPFTIANT